MGNRTRCSYLLKGNPSGPRDCSRAIDRKSTRLNSSHRCISYAVFCLKQRMSDHFTLGDDTFLAPAAGLARIRARLADRSNRRAQPRTKHVSVSAIFFYARGATPDRTFSPPKTLAA